MNYNLNITNIPNLKPNKPLSREAEGPGPSKPATSVYAN